MGSELWASGGGPKYGGADARACLNAGHQTGDSLCSRARAPVQRQRPACGAGRVGAPGLSALGLSCHEGHRSAGWCLGGPSAHCWWPRGLFPVCDLVGRFLCRSALSLWGPKMLGRLLPGWAHLPSLSSRQPLSVGATCVSSLVAAWPLVLTPLLCLEGPRFLCGLAVEMQELDLPGGGGPAAALRRPCCERGPSSRAWSRQLPLQRLPSSARVCSVRPALTAIQGTFCLRSFSFYVYKFNWDLQNTCLLNVLVRYPLFLLSLEQVGQS